VNENQPTMPPLAEFFLTRKVPCSFLAVILLTTLFWIPGLFASLPPLAFMVSFGSSILHMLTPGLFAIISIGGGLAFTLHTAVISAFLVWLLSGFAVWPAIMVMVFYAVVPMLAGQILRKPGGFQLCMSWLLIAMLVATLVFLAAGAWMQDSSSIQAFVRSLIEPVLAAVPNPEKQLTDDMVEQATQFLVWVLPGSLALSFWSIWSLNVLFARQISVRYGFFSGDQTPMLELRFNKSVAYAFVVMLLLANFTEGSVQYIAVCAAFLFGGALSVQGVFVTHLWLRARDMQLFIAVMYVLLLMWSLIVIPFMVLGLLDIWYDFRRKFGPAIGGK